VVSICGTRIPPVHAAAMATLNRLEALAEQIRELERQGLQELMFATGVDEKWRFAEEFARQVMARV
jgi:hypothetical protein